MHLASRLSALVASIALAFGAVAAAQPPQPDQTQLPPPAEQPQPAPPDQPQPPPPDQAQQPPPETALGQPPPPGAQQQPPGDESAAVPPPQPVQAQPLAPLDLFSAGRDTGLGPDLWKGSSAELARAVIPALGDHPVTPAAAALARRVLAAAAAAPPGAGNDANLAAARARALLALGDADTASLILDHSPSLADNPALSQTAAEAALIDDQDDKACAIADALVQGRSDVYWLRLRAFCQARAGKPAAQLTMTLADQAAKDPVFDRMIAVIIAGGGSPGPASLHDGLEYAMSTQLKLDLTPALLDAAPPIAAHIAALRAAQSGNQIAPSLAEADVLTALRKTRTFTEYAAAARLMAPSIAALAQAKATLANPVQMAAAALAAGDLADAQAIRASLTGDTIPGADSTDLAALDAALALAAGRTDAPSLDRLIERGGAASGEAARAQAGAAFLVALGWSADGSAHAEFAGFNIARGDAPPARIILLNAAADAHVRGDTAMLVLALAETQGPAGPNVADRAAAIRALDRAGLHDDAHGFAVEGLIGVVSR